MTEEAGDVRTQPFDEIWKTSPVFERLRTQAYSGACGTCDYKDGCGGCRARAAYYHDGDILAQDDYCAHGQQLDVHSAIAERTARRGGYDRHQIWPRVLGSARHEGRLAQRRGHIRHLSQPR